MAFSIQARSAILAFILSLAVGAPAALAQATPPAKPHVQLSPEMREKLFPTTSSLKANARPYKMLDPLGVHTSRPLMAVGDIVSVDLTSRTVVLTIDRAHSSLPHILQENAEKKKVLEKLIEREFPAQRSFPINRTTLLADPERAPGKRMETEREHLAREVIRLEDFQPGDHVSVLFRQGMTPDDPPWVFNMIKQPRGRTDYAADYRPMPVVTKVVDANKLSTETRAALARTSATLRMRMNNRKH